jgi:hypothetical protein
MSPEKDIPASAERYHQRIGGNRTAGRGLKTSARSSDIPLYQLGPTLHGFLANLL